MSKNMLLICTITFFCNSFSMLRFGSPTLTESTSRTDKHSAGGLTVITGPMACGKSDELMKTISVLLHAKRKILICKHSFDTRSAQFLVSRRKTQDPIAANLVTDPREILTAAEQEPVEYVAIDEVQFFKDNPLTDVVQKLIHMGIYVIVSGLDKDFKGDPFGKYAPEPLCMPSLLSIADETMKLRAVCEVCKQWNATMTQRLINGEPAYRTDPLVVVDDGTKKEITYEPRCREHHQLLE